MEAWLQSAIAVSKCFGPAATEEVAVCGVRSVFAGSGV